MAPTHSGSKKGNSKGIRNRLSRGLFYFIATRWTIGRMLREQRVRREILARQRIRAQIRERYANRELPETVEVESESESDEE
ncbi:hypothetical protein BJ508DRAFT_336895 [Ascobolus immersus RN42]|uniref:Uncharacterized protein n=1 Tax=Ascobolus immersus RN42 TaxID=1160509 RepID=A0A3N4HE12_ASCIM|nr:hypothetical protein BJ508DRAFT_336895 [Ascobolus immersus RN42]